MFVVTMTGRRVYSRLLLAFALCYLAIVSEADRFHDLDKHGGKGDEMEIMKALSKKSENRRREEKKAQRMWEYEHKQGRFNPDPDSAAHEKKRIDAIERKQQYLRRESRHKRKRKFDLPICMFASLCFSSSSIIASR